MVGLKAPSAKRNARGWRIWYLYTISSYDDGIVVVVVVVEHFLVFQLLYL